MTCPYFHAPRRPQNRQRMPRLPLLLFLFSSVLLLEGCSTTSETFDTPPGEGVGAKPITEVNAMVDRGEVPRSSQGGEFSAPSGGSPVFSTTALHTPPLETLELSKKTLIYRQPEKHVRVWMAPYQDAKGNLHEGALIHALTTPSYWQMGPNPFYQ